MVDTAVIHIQVNSQLIIKLQRLKKKKKNKKDIAYRKNYIIHVPIPQYVNHNIRLHWAALLEH